jgi:hypothetical protein
MKYRVTWVMEVTIPDDEVERAALASNAGFLEDVEDLDQYTAEPGRLANDIAYDFLAAGNHHTLVQELDGGYELITGTDTKE